MMEALEILVNPSWDALGILVNPSWDALEILENPSWASSKSAPATRGCLVQ